MADKKRYFETNTHSLLIVTEQGLLKRLYCPFRVECIRKIDSFMIGEKLNVMRVTTSDNGMLVYVIDTRSYHYYYFSLTED